MIKMTYVAEDGTVLFVPTCAVEIDEDIGLTIEQIAEEHPLYLKEIADRFANAEQRIELFERLKNDLLGLLEKAAEEIENLYGKDTDLTLEIRDLLNH